MWNLSVRERLFCWSRTASWHRSLSCLLLSIIVLTLPAVAGTTAPSPGNEEEAIIVTASRLPQLIEEVPASVEVITAEEIRAAGATTVEDALTLGANVVVRTNGDTGALSTANLQGATSNQVQVQLNGRPINPGTSSSVDLSLLPLGDIERIEIVKGAASAQYGANAIGGVVNIITKEPVGAVPEHALTTILGAGGEKRFSLTSEGRLGSAAYLLTAGVASASGVRTNSDFAHQTVTGRVDWEHRSGTWSLNTRYSSREAGSPGPDGGYGFGPTPLARQADRATDIDLQYSIGEDDELVARVYHSANSIVYDDPDDAWSPHSEIDSQVTGVETRRTLDLGAHRLVFGGEYRYDMADSTFYSGPQAARSLALYLEDLISTKSPWSFTVGGRLDSDSRYGQVFSPRAAAVYRLSEGWRVWATVGQAFRAPSFNELYWGGSRQLDPEVATSYQLGSTAGPLSLSLYYKDVVNYLKWDGADDVANVTSRFTGAEASYRWRIGSKVELDLAGAWVDAVKASDHSRLTDVPGTQISATLRSELAKGWLATARLYRQGAQLTNDYSTFPATIVTAPGFTTVDCTLTRQVNQDLGLQVKLENLLNAEYERVPGYPMPGASLSVGLDYRF